MKNKGQVWVSDKDLNNDAQWRASVERENLPDVHSLVAEANESLSGNRRDFLKMLGFSLSAAVVASCEIPVKKALPYVVKPEEIVPGNAVYFASSFVTGSDYCPVIVKTREGRPIKIEGNPQSKMTGGGTSARAQAMVLSLYDMYRLRHPGQLVDNTLNGMSWEDLDNAIIKKLKSTDQIRILTHTTMSPSFNRAIDAFQSKYPNTKVVTYDPFSSTAMLLANEADFGQKVIPGYRFDKADVVVSFNADFLGTWISPVEYAHQYSKKRSTENFESPEILKHFHVENGMSLTGSNADERILVKPSHQGSAIVYLYNAVAALKGGTALSSLAGLDEEAKSALNSAAKALVKAGSNALVVSSTNNVTEQRIINALNQLLGAYGTTIDFNEASYQRQGDDRAIRGLLKEMQSGQVDALFIHYANPVYDTPFGDDFKAAMDKVALKVGIDTNANETNVLCDFLAPDHHQLESWGDVNPKRGMYSFLQPTISPLFKTRQAGESFLSWADSDLLDKKAEQPYFEFVKAHWVSQLGSIEAFDKVLESGLYEMAESPIEINYKGDLSSLNSGVTKPGSGEYEISILESVGIGNGLYGNNPWLMEMPDPITRCSWGNYLQVPIHFNGVNDFTSIQGIRDDGALLNVNIGEKGETALPVFRQFGLMDGTLSMTLGYGRTMAGPVGSGFGHSMYPYLTEKDGLTQYFNDKVSVGKATGEKEEHFACVQYHHTFGIKDLDKSGKEINADEAALISDDWKGITSGFQGALTDRSIVYYTPLHEKDEFVKELKEKREEAEHLNQQTLYPYDKYKAEKYDQGHHWELYIDTNKCTGCAACTISCMAENNVPIVGKREVSRHHEMTWLRIDRYYFGDAKNPNTFYQPMMCQQCDNAPCENVCPVNATNHSSEGINQMAYNRCIGTRYCANNCPYKVRRFNWLDYTTADLFRPNEPVVAQEELPFGADSLFRMILNPDVTVRSRGVIEKCSFCVQRIQEGKLNAKIEGRRLKDGDIKTACQTACPTGAIVFGDQNNEESALTKLKENPLTYYVLEEIDVRPTVAYRAKVLHTEKVDPAL